MSFDLDFSFAHGGPLSQGRIRSCPEDFCVDEVLPFEPSGEGEHIFLHVRKCNTNTEWLAKQLARFADVKVKDVGYAGLKDRNAVTTQWFSLQLPGKPEPDWSELAIDDVQVLGSMRHNRKLKKGSLKENHFRITLREIDCDPAKLDQRLMLIREKGVPNYFGEQRFGHNGENLNKALAMFRGEFREKNRHRRGLYLSAARSWVFNQVLSERVRQGTWDQALGGDCMTLDGSHSFFCIDEVNEEILRRTVEQDIHPSGPLWGKGDLPTSDECRELESRILTNLDQDWKTGLEKAGLKQERRALRLRVGDLEWVYVDQVLEVRFSLQPGSYATSVLREIASW